MAYLDEHGLSVFWNKIKEYVQGQIATGGSGTALAPENGGTGQTSLAATRGAMGLGYSTTTLAVENGGTGVTTLDGFKTNLGLGETQAPTFRNLNLTTPLTVASGGTGKSTLTSNAVLTGNGQNGVNEIASTSGAFYSTSANAVPMFGTLPILQGGTGLTTNPTMLTNLSVETPGNVLVSSPRPGVTGTLPISHGGTGATTQADARSALGLGPNDDFTMRNLTVNGNASMNGATFSDGNNVYGAVRFNPDQKRFEYWNGSTWVQSTPAADRLYVGSIILDSDSGASHIRLWGDTTFKQLFHTTDPGLCHVSCSNAHWEACHSGPVSAQYHKTDTPGWHACWTATNITRIPINYAVFVPQSVSTV